MRSHSEEIAKFAQGMTDKLLSMQNLNQESPDYGKIIMPEKGYEEPGAYHIPIVHFVGQYYYPSSPYRGDEKLLKAASLLIDKLLDAMHEDGTMDLRETNFHDATAVAFTFIPLAHAYRVIKKHDTGTVVEKEVLTKMFEFFTLGAEGIVNGGFHTPNHRWVMAAALSLAYNILGDNNYRKEAMKYLNEGIDCDQEGEYIERSSGVYDIAINESLIVVAQELDMPELLSHVVRNMRKNFTYFEPDGTICTLNSRRYDNGLKYYPLRHYLNALILAVKFNDSFFAGMAEYILDLMKQKEYKLVDYLFTGGKEDVHTPILYFLLYDELSDLVKPQKLTWDGQWYYPINGVLRYRHDDMSLTLLKEREVFFKYQKKNTALAMKIGSCFFGQGYFTPQSIEETEDGYRLKSITQQGYYKPLNKKIDSSEFYNIRHTREKTQMQKHETTVDIQIAGSEIYVKVKMDGTKDVPMKIELMLDAGGILETEDTIMRGEKGTSAIIKNGDAVYTTSSGSFKISNCTATHHNTGNMRGTAQESATQYTVYMTGFTPFDHTFKICGGDI